MPPHIDITDFIQGNFGHVYLGDDEPCNIVGKGCVQVKNVEWEHMAT